MKLIKSMLSVILILAMLVQLSAAAVFAAKTTNLSGPSFNGEGVWITEIYNNDVDRSSKNNTRDTSGYIPVDLFTSASDLMEFIEICSTHDDDIAFNDLYEIYIDDTLMTVTDLNGSSAITLTKGQSVVVWNYRTDITMPTEAQFRSALRIPDDALILQVNYGSNWPAASGTFTIKDKQTGNAVSSFTATQDVHTKDGLAVELRMPFWKDSAMEVYRSMNLPSAGRVYSAQLRGLTTAKIPSGFNGKGVYITELHPNDINRSATYGTESDTMECFEITNTTDADVDLNTQYKLCYTVKEGFRRLLPLYKYSSSASNHLGNSTNCIVPAGGSVVIWCYRFSSITDYTSYPTLSQFRSAYGISSDTKVYLFVDQTSMSNEGRGIELFKVDSSGDLGELVSSYFYQGETDCGNGLSAQLKINPEGPAMLLNAANADATLGTVDPAQLEYVMDDGSCIRMRLYDGQVMPETILQGQDLRVYFYYKSNGDLTRLFSNTYYRLDGTGDWILSEDGGIRVPNRYETVIPAYELFDHDFVEFYVTSGNEYRTTALGVYRVDIKKLNDVDGIRTNLSEGEAVHGTVSITANDGTANNSNTKIYIDGVKQTTTPMLEDGGYFTYRLDDIDSYFRTAITTNKNVLISHIGKWAFENPLSQVRHIDNSYFSYNASTDSYNVALRFWAGNYGTYANDPVYPDANREDFSVTNLKMKLPNGKSYLPSKVGPASYNGVDTSEKTNLSTDFDAIHYLGDSTGRCPYMNVHFSIPASEVTAVGVQVDTTKLSEGVHTLKVTNGTDSKQLSFIVDNTAPAVDMGVDEGEALTGSIVLNPQVTEANELNRFVVCLDGQAIALPYETTAYALGAGSHVLTALAVDAAGNEKAVTRNFTVEDVSMVLTDAGTGEVTFNSANVYLSAHSTSDAQVRFYKAEPIEAGAIEETTVAGNVPYVQYTIHAPNAQPGDDIVVNWNGSASGTDADHKITMFVKNTAGHWDNVAVADNGTFEDISFPAENHIIDGKATVLIQSAAEKAVPDLDPATDGVTGNNAGWDGKSAPNYDFAFAWISDTQIYVQRYQSHLLEMNQWIVDNAEKWKIKYVIHTGDIVDDWDTMYQWENADAAMKIFDDAGMPYGVLAGNHDVASGLDLRDNYYTYFGEDRVKGQSAFGEAFENNYGHYDLISQNGQDFIILYMSWNINEAEINWMNEVLAKYSDRKAILNFHAYTHVRESVDGFLDYFGVLVQNQVVAKNPNVFAVLNGHYSGSTYQTVRFDDNGDGTLDRTVYQICTDYQSVTQGGMQYIKFLYFDLDNNKVFINSYSPYYDDFNYYDTDSADNLASKAKAASDGVARNEDIDALILNVKFDTATQTISPDSFSATLYTDELLTTADMAAGGSAQGQITGLSPATQYQWYAEVENEDSGILRTDVYSFTTAAAPVAPTVSLKYPTLVFEDVIMMNVYFAAENLENVVEMGLITYKENVEQLNVDNADAVVPGYTWSEADGLYYATTKGIAAKDLGDDIFFAVYAKRTDGSYYYNRLVFYSPRTYAYSSLATGSAAMKPIVIAMLNYGSAAQSYFNYKTDTLVNADLTDEQKGLVESYRTDMITPVASPDTGKQGAFITNGGFSRRYPTVSFEGAFCINYYCVPSAAVSGDITLYYWDQLAYDTNGVLTAENATAAIPMVSENGEYHATVEGIAAKDLSRGVYVAFVYYDGTAIYSSGILAYSIGTYCATQATGTGATADLAKATAVYGYYANELFNK